MMASSWNLQCLLNQRLSLWHLTVVLAVIWFFSVTETAVPLQLRGEVGQNVTFTCPVEKQKSIKFFYLQRDKKFVNGYYSSKNISGMWENTEVDKTTVRMFRLNVSHSGTYQCFIQYTDNQMVRKDIHLSVTANYSKPTFTMFCENHSCLVTCASQGGYPHTKIMWNVIVPGNTSSQMWKVLNSSEETDPDTQLVNSSSTACFNCSYGVQEHLRCSVGDVTSDMFSVCVPKELPAPNNLILAICAGAVTVIMAVSGLLCSCRKKRRGGAAAGDVRPEEVIVLKCQKEGEEAS